MNILKMIILVGVTILLLNGVNEHVDISMGMRNIPLVDIIIVDNEGDGDFLTIKEALAISSPGDIIEVYSGTYNEHDIKIETEDIILQGIPYELGNGNDTGSPFIDGMGIAETLEIYTSNVTVDGFHIENEGLDGNTIISIYQDADGCKINNNVITKCAGSIIWTFGSHTKITNNTIGLSLIRQGVDLVDPSNYNEVINNEIYDVITGIDPWGSSHNIISDNIIRDCIEFGIDIDGNWNLIEGNTIENNTVGVQKLAGYGNRIINNNFINNQWQSQFEYGFPIWLSHTNRWSGNYWGEPRILPYPIRGTFLLIPWVTFDWQPASEIIK